MNERAGSPPGSSRPPFAEAVEVIECEARPVASPPLHIAFALGGTDLGTSGIGTYVREVLPPLVQLVGNAGGRLTAFGHRRELAAYARTLEGATTRRLPRTPLRPALNALWHLAWAGTFARKLGADVLLLPAANRRICSRPGLPTVAVVHDLAQLRVDRKYDAWRMLYFRRLLVPAFHRPARLIAVSGATRDDLTQALGVCADRIRIVYNGVNAERFRATDATSEAVWHARRGAGLELRPYLLYPARLEHPGKNHVRLLRAFARSGLAVSHTLALSGADWGAGRRLRALVRELGLSDQVRLLGFVPHAALPALVAGADAVLMLGLHEGFGLPPLEALSAGRPVCVSRTGALPEVVGSLGVQCDPWNEAAIATALNRIVRDEGIRRRCRDEGPAWAGRFTWARTAGGLLDACIEALEP